mmetsp:Transcript_24062/g.39812  ORF Transcript_24062/g.39812 Transcript_24062/m.39812 type:complete len:232 (-) Transcript_24062:1324-2019(-)
MLDGTSECETYTLVASVFQARDNISVQTGRTMPSPHFFQRNQWPLPDGIDLGTLSSDTTSELDILGHDGHTLGVNSTQVSILKETDEVGLGGLLEGEDGSTLETKIRLEILSNLTHKSLERCFADQEVSRFLVLADLTESDSSGTVAVGLLDSSSGWSGLASSLGCQLFTRGLSSGGLACGLLGTSHCSVVELIDSMKLLNLLLLCVFLSFVVWVGGRCKTNESVDVGPEY